MIVVIPLPSVTYPRNEIAKQLPVSVHIGGVGVGVVVGVGVCVGVGVAVGVFVDVGVTVAVFVGV